MFSTDAVTYLRRCRHSSVPFYKSMDIDKLQSGGYDSGLGEEVGQDCDGCWAPPPSTAPSPEPHRSSDNATPSEPSPDFGPLMDFGSASNFDLLTADEGPRVDSRETALFIPTTLETIYELPSSTEEKLSTILTSGFEKRRRLRFPVFKFREKLHKRGMTAKVYSSNQRFSVHVRRREVSIQDISKKFNSLEV